ncbi:helix-turn-helix transcriptional regulator [Streptomyces sp. NPDC127084]|uniref:helix-turn-helix transcriptional regulator n=1 Tax=Streptomyces sp. NPDC127084 TaxID=3347133 RepID=UPI0036490E76
MDREYAQPLDVEALARGVNMSAGHLSRQFRLAYGESPYSYLMTRRIERAMALLRRGDLSVTEVCFAVGCSSLGTFSSRFTELVGVPPSAYRREAALAARGTAGSAGAAGSVGTADTERMADVEVAAGVEGVAGIPPCVAKQVTRPVRDRSGIEKRAPRPRA